VVESHRLRKHADERGSRPDSGGAAQGEAHGVRADHGHGAVHGHQVSAVLLCSVDVQCWCAVLLCSVDYIRPSGEEIVDVIYFTCFNSFYLFLQCFIVFYSLWSLLHTKRGN
jgi:hypothetical protein